MFVSFRLASLEINAVGRTRTIVRPTCRPPLCMWSFKIISSLTWINAGTLLTAQCGMYVKLVAIEL